MKVSFNAVIFFDVADTSLGHPISRIFLNDYVQVEFSEEYFHETYAVDYDGFIRWSNMVDFYVNKFISSVFDGKVIFGRTSAVIDEDTGTEISPSEAHAIRTADIRNVMVVEFEETKMRFFEENFNFSF